MAIFQWVSTFDIVILEIIVKKINVGKCTLLQVIQSCKKLSAIGVRSRINCFIYIRIPTCFTSVLLYVAIERPAFSQVRPGALCKAKLSM